MSCLSEPQFPYLYKHHLLALRRPLIKDPRCNIIAVALEEDLETWLPRVVFSQLLHGVCVLANRTADTEPHKPVATHQQ